MKTKPMEPRKGNETDTPQRRVKDAHLKFDDLGREIMDPKPIAPPIGYKKAPSIADQMRAMIRSERLRAEAEAAGYETFEEADDFDVGDDFDPTSPYEEVFEPLPQNDDNDRLKTLGDHIGSAIVSKLGGDLQPDAPEPAAPVEQPPQPGSGRREPPDTSSPSPKEKPPAGKSATLASGFLKPRAT